MDFDLPEYTDDDPYQSGEDPTNIRDQGRVDPTASEGGIVIRAEPFDYGTDSMGRRYPRGKYGYRITPGSRRPEGAPPNIWKNLSKEDTAELSKGAKTVEQDAAASSSCWRYKLHTSWSVSDSMNNGLQNSSLTPPSRVG